MMQVQLTHLNLGLHSFSMNDINQVTDVTE